MYIQLSHNMAEQLTYYLKSSSNIFCYTQICKCIGAPVKGQCMGAHFVVAVCHRGRVAAIINLLSFIGIGVRGFPNNLGKIFTGFAMKELESWSISFFDTLFSKIVEKCVSVTFKFCHFKASVDYSTKIKWEPLDIDTSEWTGSWWLLLPFFCDKQPFQSGHLCAVSLLGCWYTCISVYSFVFPCLSDEGIYNEIFFSILLLSRLERKIISNKYTSTGA